MNMAFYRLDDYLCKRNTSSVYRLEVWDERDTMVKQWKADETASWKGDGMCGEQTPVFGGCHQSHPDWTIRCSSQATQCACLSPQAGSGSTVALPQVLLGLLQTVGSLTLVMI